MLGHLQRSNLGQLSIYFCLLDDCTVLSCGPNTFCLLAHGKASCECLKGYSGNPRNTRVGCDKFTPNIAPTDPGVCSYKDK